MSVRVLCLGNELLGDDALGRNVAEQVRQLALADLEVIHTPDTGFRLLDYVLGTSLLLVIDTMVTGTVAPGTIYVIDQDQLHTVPGCSPHYVGLNETLIVGRELGLPVPETVTILAVEAADCCTLGGRMHPAVQATIPVLVRMVRELAQAALVPNYL